MGTRQTVFAAMPDLNMGLGSTGIMKICATPPPNSLHPAAAAFAVPSTLVTNIMTHRNWLVTKVHSVQPMKKQIRTSSLRAENVVVTVAPHTAPKASKPDRKFTGPKHSSRTPRAMRTKMVEATDHHDDDIDNAMAHPDAEADEQDRQEGGATSAAPYRDLSHPHLPGQARLVREVSIA